MHNNRPKRETMPVEEATIFNLWEIAAIVEVLERKGLCTKQDLFEIISEFRQRTPRAKIPETAFPEPYLLTETENIIIDDLLELLNKHGLTSQQSLNLLERLGRIIEMRQRLAKEECTTRRRLVVQILCAVGSQLRMSGAFFYGPVLHRSIHYPYSAPLHSNILPVTIPFHWSAAVQ
ncbi:MAG: hypothetical protein OEY86_04290 [Nitrospira sp.]|nr:hypothetical protein [Nitrospira sp.]